MYATVFIVLIVVGLMFLDMALKVAIGVAVCCFAVVGWFLDEARGPLLIMALRFAGIWLAEASYLVGVPRE